MQRPDVLVQLAYIWRHVSAINRPSSGQHRIILLRYSQIICRLLKKIQGDTKKRELLKCVVAAMYSWQHCGTGTL